MRILSFILFTCLVFLSCKSDPAASYNQLDLMGHGVPLTIMAPDSVDIKKEDWIAQKGVTVTKGDDYDVQIWISQATSTDLPTLKSSKLTEVQSNRLFSKIVKEEPDGFIFENKLDSATLFYGFYHLVLQGDNQYVFQNGLRGNFTLEQAERMYAAVKPVTKNKK